MSVRTNPGCKATTYDAARRQLVREVGRRKVERGLRHAIAVVPAGWPVPDRSGHARHERDLRARLESGKQRGRHAERTERVHVEMLARGVEVERAQRVPPCHPGVVDEHVDLRPIEGFDKPLAHVRLPDVDSLDDAAADGVELQRRRAARGDDGVAACVDLAAELEPDPSIRPCHEPRSPCGDATALRHARAFQKIVVWLGRPSGKSA